MVTMVMMAHAPHHSHKSQSWQPVALLSPKVAVFKLQISIKILVILKSQVNKRNLASQDLKYRVCDHGKDEYGQRLHSPSYRRIADFPGAHCDWPILLAATVLV